VNYDELMPPKKGVIEMQEEAVREEIYLEKLKEVRKLVTELWDDVSDDLVYEIPEIKEHFDYIDNKLWKMEQERDELYNELHELKLRIEDPQKS